MPSSRPSAFQPYERNSQRPLPPVPSNYISAPSTSTGFENNDMLNHRYQLGAPPPSDPRTLYYSREQQQPMNFSMHQMAAWWINNFSIDITSDLSSTCWWWDAMTILSMPRASCLNILWFTGIPSHQVCKRQCTLFSIVTHSVSNNCVYIRTLIYHNLAF